MSRLRVLLAFALAPLIASCSQPRDFTAPTLTPQFGTVDDDRPVDVVQASSGRIYSLSKQSGPIYAHDNNGNPYVRGEYEKALLRRYNSSGQAIWTKELDDARCEGDPMYVFCQWLEVHSVTADAQGNVYTLTSKSYVNYDHYYDASYVSYTVDKYTADGAHRGSFYVNDAIDGPEGDYVGRGTSSIAVDGSGTVYAAGTECVPIDGEDGHTAGGDCTNTIAKYSTSGTLIWERLSRVGTPTDITVASSGNVYVVGTKGLARYSNSGHLTWTKLGNFEQVMISGSNLYTRYRKEIRKWDGNGKQLWRKVQGGLNTLVLQDMDGDGNGNVYLSGKYQVSGPNWNAVVRKLNPSGSSLWTKTYGTPAYDDAKGIATLNGSEIYTTGLTRGDLAHTNKGGEDGYVRKLNSSGNPLWTR